MATIGSTRLVTLAFVTGLCGLGGETMLFKLLDQTVGSAPVVSITVVATFIVGMGLGSILSAKVVRPAFAEFALFLYYLGWLLLFENILDINGAILGALSPILGPQFSCMAIGVVYVAPPAVLLGVMLPAVIEKREDAARPYLVQALGACVGVLLVDAILFPTVGLVGCLIVFGAAHLFATVLLLGRQFSFTRAALGRPKWRLTLVGVATGAFQGTWLFLAGLLFKPFYFVQPTVVAAMLAGLSLGTALWIKKPISFGRTVVATLIGVAISSVLAASVVGFGAPNSISTSAVQLMLLILPASIPVGALVPSFLLSRSSRTAAGSALVSISIGNAIGLGLAGVLMTVMTPNFIFVAVSGALALAAWPRSGWQRGVVAAGVGVTFLVALVCDTEAYIVRGDQGDPLLPSSGDEAVAVTQEFLGPGEWSALYEIEIPGTQMRRRKLFQSGFSPVDLDMRAESIIGVVGAAYSRSRTRALVLGGGTGRSAGAVARIFEHTDVVDIGVTVVDVIGALATDNFALGTNRNVEFHEFDAILAPHVLEGPYDLIVVTVDPGYHAKASKLYTVDFLGRVKRLLGKDGVLVYWSDSTLDAEANQILINTGKRVFEHQKLFSTLTSTRRYPTISYYLLIHADRPLVYEPMRFRLPYLFAASEELRVLPKMAVPGRTQDRRILELDERDPNASEADRLFEGCFHSTDGVHELARPARSILFGGYHNEPLTPLEPDACAK